MKEIKIKMEPDILNLFWDEEETSIGDTESISINDHYEINLDIKGLQEWLWEYENQCLIPCESGEISLEELNKTFDWNKIWNMVDDYFAFCKVIRIFLSKKSS